MDLPSVFFTIIVLASFSFATGAKDIWCQLGNHKEFEPEKCPSNTVECFKFKCHGGQWPFTIRGCGVTSDTTAVGLPGESCFQAESKCQQLGGTGSCHSCTTFLCNLSSNNRWSLFAAVVCIAIYIPMHIFLTA
uniref:Uncharacterized protein n=1 Tax=Plectus sambesii TaxID=2011161 RepID=A0A914WFI3_9BILA